MTSRYPPDSASNAAPRSNPPDSASHASPPSRPRVALVHDWLNQRGGAEGVLHDLHHLFPEAPVYTTMHDSRTVPLDQSWRLHLSVLDRVPGIRGHHQAFLPLYPLAWERTRVPAADLVVSNKSAFCHGVDVGTAVHVCYCLTPTRFLWDTEAYLEHEQLPPGGRIVLGGLLPWLRRWDLAAAQAVDRFVAISSAVQRRIQLVYGRASVVVHPATHTESYQPRPSEDFYLVLARLVPYKRIDVAVRAFGALGRRLVIVGDGRDRARLERLAGPGIEFRGRLPDEEVRDLLGRCRALIWPGVEDYGLAPVEAMASGRPVIARRGGGALDTVLPGVSGLFYDDDDPASLAAAVRAADDVVWNVDAIRTHACGFDRASFARRLDDVLREALERGPRPAPSDVQPTPAPARRPTPDGRW